MRLSRFLGQRFFRNTLERDGERGIRQWIGRGFWAVTDQGMFAASNFVLSILLARWLSAQDYGAFTVAYTGFWLLGTFHTALLTEPMLVFGPSKYKGRQSEYLKVLLYGHLGFSVLSSLLFLLIGLGFGFAGSGAVSSAFLGLALAGSFILFQWLMRRACYVRFKPHLAASGGALYMALILAGAYLLHQHNWLSTGVAFGLMGFASSAAGLWLAARLGMSPVPLVRNSLVTETLGTHWTYGRWAVVTGVLTWIPESSYYLLLPIWGSLEDTAAFRAQMNLIMPVFHAYGALSVLLLPSLVQARGRATFGHLVRLSSALFALGALLYWIFLGLISAPLVSWLYSGQYDEYAALLWILGLLPLSLGMTQVLGAALRALERPDQVFWAYVLSTIVALTMGLGFLIAWGVTGAAVGLVLSSTATAGLMAWFLVARTTVVEEEVNVK